MRRFLLAAALAAMTLTGCAPHLALSVSPDPVILGRADTHAVVSATAIGEGLGPLHIASVQVKLWGGARYLGHDVVLYTRTDAIDRTVFIIPFARVTRAYDVPINSWEMAVGNARYATVELRDGGGNVIGATRIDFMVDPRIAHKF